MNLVAKLTIFVVVLGVNIISLDAYRLVPAELTKNCDNVIEKLELFALGKSSQRIEPIKIEELEAAIGESLTWSYQEADDIKEQKPLVHLLTHLLTTMESYLSENKRRDDIMLNEVNTSYISRLQSLYRLLRQNYLQKSAGLMGEAPNTDEIDELIEALMDNTDSYESNGAILLTKELFDSASDKYDSLLKQMNDISVEPKNSQLIQGLLNVLNSDETQMLARWIFPRTKGKAKLNDEEFGELKYTFESEMNLSGFKIVDGIKINSLTNLPPPT